ncbi:hypothetical protein GCM10008090_27540 [Arenicella chitinivorans]|uniref:VWFA domain-containing protein n=2 Tax=Arenicella chitinivorans TaxID=1329800 RepID=A0A918RZ26_9GAMM|nr:hypothetical protein GCM10008090_27540 [Arenicella chitinivorans]
MLTLLQAQGSENAVDRAQMMVVLDASGSMWGQVDGRPKIELVREAFGALVDDWEAQPVDAGLIVYGHRTKGDCRDIQIIAQPGPVDAAQLKQSVAQLNPKGKTPLGDAVRMAAEQLKLTEQKATVILLSDGRETCDADPCKVGLELEETGVDFTAHVIGLDIEKEQDKRQLKCLADNTGGKYIDVHSARELNDAFSTKSDLLSSSPRLQVLATATDLEIPLTEITWTITHHEQAKDLVTQSTTLDLVDWLGDSLVAGEYTLHAKSGSYAGSIQFTYPISRESMSLTLTREIPPSRLIVADTVTASSAFEVQWEGYGGTTDAIAVVNIGDPFNSHLGQTGVRDRSPLTLIAPAAPGEYELIYVFDAYGQARVDARVPIKVKPAQFGFEVLTEIRAGQQLEIRWTGPGAQGDLIAIGPRTQKTDDHLYVNWVSEGNPITLTSADQPGEYELRYYNDRYDILFSKPIIVAP